MSRIPPEFKVSVPEDSTAQYPANERDLSRLLVYSRDSAKIIHVGKFRDIVQFIASDTIVLNNTKVIPSRVKGSRPGGGIVELLFLPSDNSDHITALIQPSRRLREGMNLRLPEECLFELIGRNSEGGWIGKWNSDKGESFEEYLERVGCSPLPPYIKRDPEQSDRKRYQTVYAETAGSVAAPTAGLHFTPELLVDLESKGSKITKLTLDVGLGTFQPIRSENLSEHDMHCEHYLITAETAELVNQAKTNDISVTAIGTTSVRALESAGQDNGQLRAGEHDTNLFIHPPDYQFKIVDKLLTNFHRTDSTLLQLVAAMIGWDGLNLAYQTALDSKFKFYSYGDAMLII
jgi:S-adenosylmethionine:tRNA ribosyltransferase-isomerase